MLKCYIDSRFALRRNYALPFARRRETQAAETVVPVNRYA